MTADRDRIKQESWDILCQIEQLNKQRLRALRSDTDYAAYIDRLGGGRSRLPISTFWTLLDRMHAIEASEPSDAGEATLYWKACQREYEAICKELALR